MLHDNEIFREFAIRDIIFYNLHDIILQFVLYKIILNFLKKLIEYCYCISFSFTITANTIAVTVNENNIYFVYNNNYCISCYIIAVIVNS